MRSKISRREAIAALSLGAASAVSATPNSGKNPQKQKAQFFKPDPVSGNNPIVVSPDDDYPTLNKFLNVNASNIGDSPGTYRIRLARYDAANTIIYINLYGFGTNSTVSKDFTLAANESIVVSFSYDNATSYFKDYSLLVLMQERTASNTYITRRVDVTQLHYVERN